MKSNLVHKLHSITYLLDQIAAEILEDNFGISYSQYLYLKSLENSDNLTQNQIADWTDLSKGLISRLTLDLQKRRLIKVNLSKTDRRANTISLTSLGNKTVSSASNILENKIINEILEAKNISEIESVIDKIVFRLNKFISS